MSKKLKCPEFENHERWLVAYADMMTLLFALFVVLYSITNVEIEKLKSVKASIQKAFGYESEALPDATGLPGGESPVEELFKNKKGTTTRESTQKYNRREIMAIINAEIEKVIQTKQEELEQKMMNEFQGTELYPKVKNDSDEKVVYFSHDKDGIRISLVARGFFKPNETLLTDDSKKILDGIAKALKGLGKIIRVEGHTDNINFNMKGMTNWELSSIRASSVVRYFINKHKFSEKDIYPAGFAGTRPIATNDSPEHRALNRRVDIKILYDTPNDYVESNINTSDDKEVPELKQPAEFEIKER